MRETKDILEGFELGEQKWDEKVKEIEEWTNQIITRLRNLGNEEVELELEPESGGEQNEEKQANL